MVAAIAERNGTRTELATADGLDDKLDLLKRTLCQGATNDEFALFVAQCKRTGLDPFSRQIYLVKRKGKMVIQTGIDGYRLIADRTGKYAGNDDPTFDNEQNPGKASVTIYKIVDGVRCAFTASARWDQYYPGKDQGFMWEKMPNLMLGKCAEALALRKAFPQELSGFYIKEEMDQAGPPDDHQSQAKPRQVTPVDPEHGMLPSGGQRVDEKTAPNDKIVVEELERQFAGAKTKDELKAVAVGVKAAEKAGRLTPDGVAYLRKAYAAAAGRVDPKVTPDSVAVLMESLVAATGRAWDDTYWAILNAAKVECPDFDSMDEGQLKAVYGECKRQLDECKAVAV